MNPVHFSSASDDWSTPMDFFKKVEAEFGPFDLDPCATAENAKAPKFYTKEEDGLTYGWSGRVYLNPPYGREIGWWIEKAKDAVLQEGAEIVVCLVPARPDTTYWAKFVWPHASEILFVTGRIKFNECPNSAPFPSVIVVFRAGHNPARGPRVGRWDRRRGRVHPCAAESSDADVAA